MNLFNRAIGGAIILALLIFITFLGRIPLAIGVMVFSYIALHEMKEALAKIQDMHEGGRYESPKHLWMMLVYCMVRRASLSYV